MKTLRDWVSCQLVTKSLVSARPFTISNPSSEEEPNQGTIVAASLSEHATANSTSQCSSSDQANVSSHPQLVTAEVPCPSHLNATTDNNKDPLAKVEDLQVSFLRLIQRIGVSPSHPMVAQVLYRLQLASLIRVSESDIKRARLKFDKARVLAAEKEASTQTDLDFSLRILLLGKTGAGKSATINSIFDEKQVVTDAFQPATQSIQEVVGTVKGVKIAVIDTPGLLPPCANQRYNRKILHAVKRFIRKSRPDIVLYLERLDLVNMGYSDFPLLKLITDEFGPSIWFNTILVMTHSCSLIPEGTEGYPVNYEAFVTRRTNLVQHFIHQAVQDTKLEVPVLLVENHPLCKTNWEGEKILPNGEVWRYQFLLLCISSKILADANKLFKFQEIIPTGQTRTRLPSFPHLLSLLLRPRSLPGSGDAENKLSGLSDSDEDDDSDSDEYDSLPPIRILTNAQFQKLTKSQKKDYLDELEYRETLYLRKQWKEELRRCRESKQPKQDNSEIYDNDEMNDSPDATPLPDMVIPLNFDSDCPVHRYRALLNDTRYFVRPVLNSEGWDHDIGFDGINLESSIDITQNFHAFVLGQMSKDKEELNLQAEFAAKYADNRGGPSLIAGLDVQTAGEDLMYTVRGDAKFRNLKHNTTGLGLSLTSFQHMYLYGAKLEDSISFRKRFRLGLNVGSLYGCGQVACGGGVEATIRGKNYPVRDDKLVVGATLISFANERVLGGSIQGDFRACRGTKMSVNANLNSRKMGQVSLKINSSEHIEIALIGAISIAQGLYGYFRRPAIEDLTVT